MANGGIYFLFAALSTPSKASLKAFPLPAGGSAKLLAAGSLEGSGGGNGCCGGGDLKTVGPA